VNITLKQFTVAFQHLCVVFRSTSFYICIANKVR